MQDTNRQFSVPKGMYLLSHSVGCLPVLTRSSVAQSYFEPWQQHGGDAWPQWLNIIEQFCHELADLFNTSADDICPQSSVSNGLSQYLQALPLKTARTVLMHASAFPSLGFAVQGLAAYGFNLKLIDKDIDPNDLDAWQALLTDDVAVAVITHVHSNSGVLSDVAGIAQLCRAKNVCCVVDVAQSAGLIPIDLQSWQVDLVLGSCVKWLCGGPGAGFMWVNPGHVNELTPKNIGWFSHESPFEFDIEHFSYAKSAKRFWGGTPSILPYASALVGIQQINNIGVPKIYAHSKALQRIVLDHAAEYLLNPIGLAYSGGTLCLHLAKPRLEALVSGLTQANAYFDQRRDGIRLSWHIYNTEQEALQVAEIFRCL
ncbi:aminotransferase class V-fold PLP-dependent enzyme [Paraglaciecola polaris]|uniref:Aminotransferase, class V n=1 Tax=Paraglaciecola polaris LMG 21857 TaxID=1129793 RepID=K6ZYC7_9ALTE|nr:aminotransferase class V-fold PLP-dependent enzyme [Paraglaciecola polaris]GAC33748.1 aminotransferase, class V [Paraglaciecola polaris LMG 21857]